MKEPFVPYVMIVMEHKFCKCTLPLDVYEQMSKMDVNDFIARFLGPAIIHGLQEIQDVSHI